MIPKMITHNNYEEHFTKSGTSNEIWTGRGIRGGALEKTQFGICAINHIIKT